MGRLNLRSQLSSTIVENFNKTETATMATVNFSIPEDVKEKFNETFKGRNKSAVIADLMSEAIEREQQRQESQRAAKRILERQPTAPTRKPVDLARARRRNRP